MKKTTLLKLNPSEAAVLQAASRIYAARFTSNPKGKDDERVAQSVQVAIEMAKRVDALVKSDSELL